MNVTIYFWLCTIIVMSTFHFLYFCSFLFCFISYFGSLHIRSCINYVKTKKRCFPFQMWQSHHWTQRIFSHAINEWKGLITTLINIISPAGGFTTWNPRSDYHFPTMWNCDYFFYVNLNAPLSKRWLCRWFGTPWRSCDITALVKLRLVYCVIACA